MPRRLTKRNKYSKLDVKAPLLGIFPVAGAPTSIEVELSPGHRSVLDLGFLNTRPQMQLAFGTHFRLLGDSVSGISKQIRCRALKNFVVFLDEFESKNESV